MYVVSNCHAVNISLKYQPYSGQNQKGEGVGGGGGEPTVIIDI